MPRTTEAAKVRVNVDLQDDFSMNQTLSLYVLETLPLLDPESPDYALDVLTLVESILENPELILRKQLDRIKDRAVAEMKADGVEYDQRMEELEKLEYPKPLRDFVYETFNAFADRHPWVGEENIRPKSIAREMFENFRSFAEYVHDYELQRSEGLLLRHLNSVYKVLSQTVPDGVKTDEVVETGAVPRARCSARWTRASKTSGSGCATPTIARSHARPGGTNYVRRGAETAAPDITRDAKAFTAAIRTRIFTFLRAWSIGTHTAALEALDAHPPAETDADIWTPERLRSVLADYSIDHGPIRLDPEARNLRHSHVDRSDQRRTWRVQQVLVDAEMLNDWMAEFTVDVTASREANQPVLWLRAIGPIE